MKSDDVGSALHIISRRLSLDDLAIDGGRAAAPHGRAVDDVVFYGSPG